MKNHKLNSCKNTETCLPALSQPFNEDYHLKDQSEVFKSLDQFLKTRGMQSEKSQRMKKNHRTFTYLIKLQKMNIKGELNEKEKLFLTELKLLYPLYNANL